jgi:transcriptional regulator with XRE-family HTH domain
MNKDAFSDYWASLILQIRKARKWNQSELAEAIGANQATVSRWEKGETIPAKAMQLALEEFAQIDKIASIREIIQIVEASPFPMIITDIDSNILAASASSGFSNGSAVMEQTPAEEKKVLKNSNELLRTVASG